MDFLKPIFTEAAQCQDCYKCLRQCTVKAIQIQDSHARVMHDYCVMCGHCVKICPAGAKKVRDDVDKAKLLLSRKEKVIVSLAPSYVSEFKGISNSRLIEAIKKLGFYGVSETALGAEQVSANAAIKLKQEKQGVFLSSACPTVVEFIKKYHPEFSKSITSFYSPVLAHCKLLKKKYGEDVRVVFVGPCIAKKLEADQNPQLLDVALTFGELCTWLEEEGVIPENLFVAGESSEEFIPAKANEGSLYPIDGGMIAGIKANCNVNDAEFMAFSGIKNIRRVIDGLENLKLSKPLFIELLACEGGCVNGPLMSSLEGTILKRYEIIENSNYPAEAIPRKPQIDVDYEWDIKSLKMTQHSEEEIRTVLEQVGKFDEEDELNCGGCGYDSCSEFAKAMLDGKAEPSMCVSYMRQLAHKKADALMRTMPSGVVIVDDHLRIVECNQKFAELLGQEALNIYKTCSGLEGAYIEKLLPIGKLFSKILNRSGQVVEKDIKFSNSVLHLTIFTIEPNRLAGGFLQDITAPAVHKEQIINKAKEVISKNLATVQQIAYLLGENASESEVILNSIVNSFSAESMNTKVEDDK